MELKRQITPVRDIRVSWLQAGGGLLFLSVLLGICMLVLTVVPCDVSLIGELLTSPLVVALNIWPLFCVMALLFFLSARPWVSFSITALLAFIIAEVNRFKMIFRDTPFVFEDVLLVSEATKMTEHYALYLDEVSLCTLLFIVLGAVFCFFFFKVKQMKPWVRVAGVTGAVLSLVLSCNFLYFGNVYIHDITWNDAFKPAWKAGNQAMCRGVIYSFMESMPEAIMMPPEGYDKKEAAAMLSAYDTVPLEDEKKVHFISIMLEAYNDLSRFDSIEFAIDPYQNFHRLQKQAYSGRLYTNVFAGGTVETERAFLTGYGDTNFHNKNVESYVRYFKSQGYYTEAMHPCYGWFYNREEINKYLGFDNFDNQENTYHAVSDGELEEERYQGLLSDYDFFDYITAGFEEVAGKGQPYFNFSVTYQNHGPYEAEKPIPDYIRKPAAYTDEEFNTVNSYFYGIHKTDRALGKLRAYIDGCPEPVVLILFGDHNPHLGSNAAYEKLGIDISFMSPEGAANYYETPYVFYANEAAKERLQRDFQGTGSTVSPMLLMNELFEYTGLSGPAYLNYLQSVKETYSVINPVYVGKNEIYRLRSELADDETLLNQAGVEYYMKNEAFAEENQ